MVRPRPTKLLPLAVLLLAACSPSTSVPPSGQASPGSTPTVTAPASPDATPAASPGTTAVRAYFILGSHTNDSGLVPVLRTVSATGAPEAAALDALLAGPNAQELAADPAMYSWIPAGVKVTALTIADGVASVHLSRELGIAGGDAVSGSQAQVVFTLTQFPTITGVRIYIDGIVTTGPLGAPKVRADYAQFLPAIWVDQPAWGGALGNPAHVSGLANVFEAQFRIEVLDAAGKSLVDQAVTATCGSGCWGTFDVTLPYAVATAQTGTLRVYDLSAKDGSREHVVDYPVTLTP